MQRFVSQLEWRPYGHLICTPICLLAGASFLNGLRLSNEYVRQIMCKSHALYMECFASQQKPLKIQELYGLIPEGQFEIKEAAGMLFTQEPNEIKSEDLLLMSLTKLLRYAMLKRRKDDEGEDKCCVIVTTMDHTTCFLADRQCQELQWFDPLPSVLKTMPLYSLEQALVEQYGAQNASVLFSAVLLEVNKKK